MKTLYEIEEEIDFIPKDDQLVYKLRSLNMKIGEELLHGDAREADRENYWNIYFDTLPYSYDYLTTLSVDDKSDNKKLHNISYELIKKMFQDSKAGSKFDYRRIARESLLLEYVDNSYMNELFDILIDSGSVRRLYDHLARFISAFEYGHINHNHFEQSISKLLNDLDPATRFNLGDKIKRLISYSDLAVNLKINVETKPEGINIEYRIDNLFDIIYNMSSDFKYHAFETIKNDINTATENKYIISKILAQIVENYDMMYNYERSSLSSFIYKIFDELLFTMPIGILVDNIDNIWTIIDKDSVHHEHAMHRLTPIVIGLLSYHDSRILSSCRVSIIERFGIQVNEMTPINGKDLSDLDILLNNINSLFTENTRALYSNYFNIYRIFAQNISNGCIDIENYSSGIRDFLFSPLVKDNSKSEFINIFHNFNEYGIRKIAGIFENTNEIENPRLLNYQIQGMDNVSNCQLRMNNHQFGSYLTKKIVNNGIIPSPIEMMEFLSYYNRNYDKLSHIPGYNKVYRNIILCAIGIISIPNHEYTNYKWNTIIEKIVYNGDSVLVKYALIDILSRPDLVSNQKNDRIFYHFIKISADVVNMRNIPIRRNICDIIKNILNSDNTDYMVDLIRNILEEDFDNININGIHTEPIAHVRKILPISLNHNISSLLYLTMSENTKIKKDAINTLRTIFK